MKRPLVSCAALLLLGCRPSPASAPVDPPEAAPAPAADPSPEPATPIAEEPVLPPPYELVGYDESVATALTMRAADSQALALVRVDRYIPVRLHADGPEVGIADGRPMRRPFTLPVLTEGDRLRSLYQTRNVRWLLYLDASQASPTVEQPTILRSTPEADVATEAQRTHVELVAGAHLTVEETGPEMTKVSVSVVGHEHTGWVANNELTTTWVEGEFPASDHVLSELRRDVQLRPEPGRGQPIAEIAKGAWVHDLGQTRKGHRLIRYMAPCDRVSRVAGWVPKRTLEPVPSDVGRGYGCGFGTKGNPLIAPKDVPKRTIEEGRFLIDPASKHVVGCTVRESPGYDMGDGTVSISTVFGPIAVELAPASVDEPCGVQRR